MKINKIINQYNKALRKLDTVLKYNDNLRDDYYLHVKFLLKVQKEKLYQKHLLNTLKFNQKQKDLMTIVKEDKNHE